MVVKENCSEFFEFKKGGKKEKSSKICKNSAKCGKLAKNNRQKMNFLLKYAKYTK